MNNKAPHVCIHADYGNGFAFRCEDNYPLKIAGSVYAGDSIAKINNGECISFQLMEIWMKKKRRHEQQ